MLTKEEQQEIVDHVVTFIVKQGAPGTDGEACVYLCKKSDRQCLIGSLLTDEQCAEATAENYSVGDIIERGWNGWDLDDSPLLTALQNCHDRSVASSVDAVDYNMSFLNKLDKQLSDLCKRKQLVYPGGLS